MIISLGKGVAKWACLSTSKKKKSLYDLSEDKFGGIHQETFILQLSNLASRDVFLKIVRNSNKNAGRKVLQYYF